MCCALKYLFLCVSQRKNDCIKKSCPDMLNAAYQALHIFPGNSWGTDITILKKNLVKKSRYDIFRCNRHLCSTQTLSSNIPFAFLTHPNMKKGANNCRHNNSHSECAAISKLNLYELIYNVRLSFQSVYF